MFQEQSGGKGSKRKRRSKLKPRGKTWLIARSWIKRVRPVLRKGEEKDWSAMPRDCLSAIYEKLGPINVLLSAQFVCRSWQQAAHDPRSWRCADFTIAYWDVFDPTDCSGYMETVMATVDRSKGAIEEFALEYASQEEDEALLYAVRRSCKLKRLKLVNCLVDDETMMEAFEKCPLLEDIDVTIHNFREDLFDDRVNPRWPPQLKRFCLNDRCAPRPGGEDIDNDIALCVARNMPQLRELQLICDSMSNDGLRAILDGCPHLESLDLRLCLNVDLRDEDIKRKCSRIKNFKGPHDSMKGFPIRLNSAGMGSDDDETD